MGTQAAISDTSRSAAGHGTPRMIRAEGLEIATEAFGDPAHPPVLLIMGGMASMLWWPEAFCRRLAEHGRFVIRYDQRDTGLSTKYPPGRPGYGFDDAVDDVFRVLDGYGISTAHIVGFSLGGMVGQGAALKFPERVLSLTAISTSPLGTDTSHLPASGEAWMEHMSVEADWSDRADAVAYLVEDARLVASTAHPFDEAGTRAFIERDFDRSDGYLSATNHSVLFDIGQAWQGRLHEMKVPLLVVHGTADPVFPVEHGAALADAVASARFATLEGGGHELHPGHWETILGAIAAHPAASQTERKTSMTANADVVKKCFEAYRRRNRALIESLIADDFSFTSPYDDAIDRKTYFERCWPNSDVIEEHVLERVIEDGDDVIVRYLCRTREGKEFRNVEILTVGDGRITAVEVYFGAAYRDGTFVKG